MLRLQLSKNKNPELKVNNNYIVWKPMSLLEDRSWETGGGQVANVCVVNGVKGAELMTFILPWELDEVSTAFIP